MTVKASGAMWLFVLWWSHNFALLPERGAAGDEYPESRRAEGEGRMLCLESGEDG